MPDPAYHPLARSVARSLRRRCGVLENERVLVAVSGGADSVAMLRVLAILAPRRKWRLRLAVGHVQHHLRPEAEADAEFVESLAESVGLPYERRDLDLRPGGGDTPVDADRENNLEARARVARYAALGDMAQAAECPFIATAHHADDQLETLLMRVLRGTDVAGLRGIAWRRPLDDGATLIRPMLASDHAEAIDFLGHLGQVWCEDATNLDTQRTRARLRRDVLPVLRDLRPSVARKSVELGDRMRRAFDRLRDTGS